MASVMGYDAACRASKNQFNAMMYKIVSTVTGTFFPKGVRHFLEDLEIDLVSDGGSTRHSTDVVDVTGKLDVVCRVNGWNGTKWTLTLDVTRPDDPGYQKTIKLVDRKITAKQTDLCVEAVDLLK